MSIEITGNVAIVDEYSLADFVASIEKLVKEGYSVSYEGSNYPQGMSGWYRVGMIKNVSEGTNSESTTTETGGVESTPATATAKPKRATKRDA